MKIKFALSIAVLCFTTLFTGCSKDDEPTTTTPTPNNPGTGGLLTAKINGTAWAPPADSAVATLMSGEINITGIASDGRTITITLMDTIPGIYDLSFTGSGAGVYQATPTATVSFDSQWGPYDVTTNYVNITSIDKANKKMTGTFAFKALSSSTPDSVSVSEGTFTNLPYVTSVVSTGNNSFNVDIGGVAFHPTLLAGVVAGGKINISASTGGNPPTVGLMVPDNVTAGTYALTSFGTYDALYNASSTLFMTVSTGSITITEHNTITNKLVGTFNFTAIEFGGTITANLTNGSFTIYYQ